MVVKIGIIGGSGLEKTNVLENPELRDIGETPYGRASDSLLHGTINSVPVVFLPRHGRAHGLSPTNVNYRANLLALHAAGVDLILAASAVGSLREEIPPGTIVFPHSYIDRTTRRENTFYDGQPGHFEGVAHIPMHPAFNERLREILIESAREENIPYRDKAVSVCIEGPRFSTRAESELFRSWGADLVNMTLSPEAALAKELGIPYASTSLVTDYDCWRDSGEGHVCVDKVMAQMKSNAEAASRLFIRAIGKIGAGDWSDEIQAAKRVARGAVMLPPDVVLPHLGI